MPIRFTCPNPACGKTIGVKDKYAGLTAKCPGCQTPVTIPTPAVAAPVAPPEPAFELVEDAEPEAAPPPKPKPAPVQPRRAEPAVEAAAPPSRRVKAAVVEADDDPPARRGKPAPEPLPLPDDDEQERPARAAPRNLKKAAVDTKVAAILGRSEWYVREDGGLFSGNTLAGLFETPESEEPLAVVRDATRKLFGFVNFDVMGFRPQVRFQVRERDKNGAVILTLERFVPRFDLPFTAPKPTRWEVRGPDDTVVGSLTLSRKGFSLVKLLKGRFFQGETQLLDAEGRPAGAMVIERGMVGAPKRVAIEDEDGQEYGRFGSQLGRKVAQKIEEAKQQGKKRGMWTSVSVMGKGDEDERGMIGRVNPDRADDEYARVMTFATTVLLEVLGYDAFGATKGKGK
jgi:hypothetical protein